MLLLSGCAQQINVAENTLATMINNMQRSVQGIWTLVVAGSYIIGVSFVILSIFKLKKYGQMRTMMDNNANITGPVLYLFIGIVLIYVKEMADIVLATVWSNESLDSLKSWQGGGQTGIFGISYAVQQIIRLMGLIAFVRGWMILAKLSSESRQPGTLSKGLLHIFGGILGINIGGTLELLHATLLGT